MAEDIIPIIQQENIIMCVLFLQNFQCNFLVNQSPWMIIKTLYPRFSLCPRRSRGIITCRRILSLLANKKSRLLVPRPNPRVYHKKFHYPLHQTVPKYHLCFRLQVEMSHMLCITMNKNMTFLKIYIYILRPDRTYNRGYYTYYSTRGYYNINVMFFFLVVIS